MNRIFQKHNIFNLAQFSLKKDILISNTMLGLRIFLWHYLLYYFNVCEFYIFLYF